MMETKELKKAQGEKRICLDLSLRKAKEIRNLNMKDDPWDTWAPKAPTHMEWRNFGNLGDGLMIPDKGFTKQLHCLDPELEVAWDWGSSKWEIWRFPKDGSEAFHVMTVQTKDRTYKELGADVLLQLQKGDPARFTRNELVAYLDELDNQERRRKAKEFSEKIRSIALDSFLNIHCKIIQVPKAYSVGRAVSCQ
jgi:hypothetical protein